MAKSVNFAFVYYYCFYFYYDKVRDICDAINGKFAEKMLRLLPNT